MVGGVVGYVALFAVLLFAGAGTLQWRRAWVLLAVLFVARLAGNVAIMRANPGLLAERAKGPLQRGQPMLDRVLLLALMAAFAAVTWFAAADVWRWRLLPSPNALVSALGLLLFVAGWWIVAAALSTNAFAVTVVRHQEDRGQVVTDRGPYTVVRHPMYSGLVAVHLGLPLWLGSTAGAVAALVPILILAVRILVEERFLRRTLDGYGAYLARVRYRIIPWLW